MSTLSDEVRHYALTANNESSLASVESMLVDSFLTWLDFEDVSLWSIQWRTFGLFVAEALES